ncbi:P-loop NTPase family protein [Archangium violaceum]|uniref:hypothetical protein n=1 Tax=Archangium violaceum TaxID=83451 RepID=UPI0036DDCB7F
MKWRAPRPHSPAKKMLETPDRPFGTPRILLMGTVGTGKTTELRRVAEEREQRELVVFLDLEWHFTNVVKDPNALYRIQAWEVCFLAGLALVFRFKERLGLELDPDMVKQLGEAWQRLAEATKTPNPQFDLGSFAKEALELGATLATTGALGLEASGASWGLKTAKTAAAAMRSWNLPLGRSEKPHPARTSPGRVEKARSRHHCPTGHGHSARLSGTGAPHHEKSASRTPPDPGGQQLNPFTRAWREAAKGPCADPGGTLWLVAHICQLSSGAHALGPTVAPTRPARRAEFA